MYWAARDAHQGNGGHPAPAFLLMIISNEANSSPSNVWLDGAKKGSSSFFCSNLFRENFIDRTIPFDSFVSEHGGKNWCEVRIEFSSVGAFSVLGVLSFSFSAQFP
jgi:hypothetical protein